MDGKTCMVTGANSGVGFVLARELSLLGAHVVMVCRDERRGRKARERILKEGGRRGIELFLCDLSSQKSIRVLASEFAASHEALHVLINNAAIVPRERALSEDGIEMQLAVNHLAPFLLTHLLLGRFTPSRIINVSSEIHFEAEIDAASLGSEKGYNAFATYARTKLYNILFTYELARRLRGTTVNCFTPGFTATNLGRGFPLPMKLGMKLFGRRAGKSATTGIHLASSDEVSGVTGKYFQNMREKESSELSYDRELALWLWGESERLCGLEGFFFKRTIGGSNCPPC